MTDPELTPEQRRQEVRRQRAARRRRRLIWLPFWGGAGLVLLVVLLAVGVRVAVLTDTGRTTLVSWLDGMDLGRFGTLQLSGLSGDVFGDFKVKRLAVVDEKGVWLEGRDVTMRWRSYSLFRRRLGGIGGVPGHGRAEGRGGCGRTLRSGLRSHSRRRGRAAESP